MPWVDGAVLVTTSTSPSRHTSTAAWIIRLSPGWHDTVTAVPARRTPCWIGRRCGPAKPRRPIASCTVAVPIAPRASTVGAVGAVDRPDDDVAAAHARRPPSRRGEDAPDVGLEDLRAVLVGQVGGVDVAAGVVVVVAGLGVDAPHRAHHLGGEQDVVGGDHGQQAVDARLVVHARVEEDVAEQQLVERRPAHVLRQAPEPAPVVRHRTAAVGDDQPQLGEVGEQVRGEQLHERRGVGAEVVRAGGVEVRVAGGAHVDHRRHVELAQRLVQRVPVAVGQRRPVPAAAATGRG